MKNSDRYELRIFLTTKLISVSIFEFYTERYIVVYTDYKNKEIICKRNLLVSFQHITVL